MPAVWLCITRDIYTHNVHVMPTRHKLQVARCACCCQYGCLAEKEICSVPYVLVDHDQQLHMSVSCMWACGFDLQGEYQVKFKLPFIPGNEVSGLVSQVGAKVKGFKIGDTVSW